MLEEKSFSVNSCKDCVSSSCKALNKPCVNCLVDSKGLKTNFVGNVLSMFKPKIKGLNYAR